MRLVVVMFKRLIADAYGFPIPAKRLSAIPIVGCVPAYNMPFVRRTVGLVGLDEELNDNLSPRVNAM